MRSQTDDLASWWTALDDPLLNELVVAAYRQNLTLQAAGVRVLQARAQLGIAVGDIYPQTQNAFGSTSRISSVWSSSISKPLTSGDLPAT